MTDEPPADRLPELLEDTPAAKACLDGLAEADARKRALRTLRDVADDRPASLDGLVESLATFLTDEDQAVRLTAAKLFVGLARSEPAVPLPAVDTLADRLADDAEFYYVRARCAEALGYVALDHPGPVGDPETLAELRIGLEFDEPEVKAKLAKALAYVALGDPSRLRYQVDSLADSLGDDDELVRYHLCTALAVVGCAHPANLSGAAAPLRDRLGDESPYVRGRAAEALGVFARSGATDGTPVDPDRLPGVDEDTPPFEADRVRFLRRTLGGEHRDAPPDGVGTVASVRAGTDDVVAAITAPDGEGECPHCGLALSTDGPPMCPRCGAPR